MLIGIIARLRTRLVPCAAVLALLLPAGAALSQQDHTVTDLGTLGGSTSMAIDINGSGQVAGYSVTFAGETHAFLWDDGVMTDLGTLGGAYSAAADINEAGQVVGTSSTAGGSVNGFIWQDGVMTNLGSIGGTNSSAVRINDAGQVTGTYTDQYGMQRAFIWEDGVMTDLGEIPGQYYYTPVDINSEGKIAMVSGSVSSVWSGGALDVLPTLPGANGTYVKRINGDGKAAGYISSYSPAYWSSAVVWENGAVTDIGNLGTRNSTAYDINDSGMAVGTTADANGASHGFSWKSGVMTDLGAGVNPQRVSKSGAIAGYVTVPGQYSTGMFIKDGDLTTLEGINGALNTRANALNDKGQVVGYSRNLSNMPHATLWEFAHEEASFRLTCASSPEGCGEVDVYPANADGMYESGSVVTLTALAAPGHVFAGWAGDVSGPDEVVDVTMDADKSVTALFALVDTDAGFTTGFCGQTVNGKGKKVPVHVLLGGVNDSAVPVLVITYPDGQVNTVNMAKLGKGKDAWKYDSLKLSPDMPSGEYTVEVYRDGVVFDPPLACSFTFSPH